MHHVYEYKLKCVQLYRQGRYPEILSAVRQNKFRQNIHDGGRVEEKSGLEVLKHKSLIIKFRLQMKNMN